MDIVLSLLEVAVKAFVKAAVTALANYAVSRAKDKTAPIRSRDGSDNLK